MKLEINLRLVVFKWIWYAAYEFLCYLTDVEWHFDYETIAIYIEI